jgi:hypothetical protein
MFDYGLKPRKVQEEIHEAAKLITKRERAA